MLTFGSLFSGIGGLDLGFERAGMVCKWQVEIDDFATKILEKHWPHVRRGRDVRKCPYQGFDCVDAICGGFPCQEISSSGFKLGLSGPRSGLWCEFARIVREMGPRFVVVENVADLVHRGLDTVLGDLAGMGFDAWWGVLPAAAFGSPQRRLRSFIIANSDSRRQQGCTEWNVYWQEHFKRNYIDGLGVAERAAAECAGRVRRISRGVPRGVDITRRIAACGNSAHPAVAEWIGKGLIEYR